VTSAANSEGGVRTVIHDGVGTVSFYHPQSNSLPGRVLEALASAITEFAHDPTVNVLVLRSDGDRAFCAGASFDELLEIDDTTAGRTFFMGFAHVINTMRRCPKFIIARVQGKAVGGGVGLAAAADYTLARDSAAIKLSELAVGIGPFVVGPAVERKIGHAAFGALAIGAGTWRSADWAREQGLYVDTFADNTALDAAVDNLAGELAARSAAAMAAIKQVLWQGTEDWDTLLAQRAEISGRLVVSDFAVSAIQKFKNK
jgi:methylglutaconyl-CoA hydratase